MLNNLIVKITLFTVFLCVTGIFYVHAQKKEAYLGTDFEPISEEEFYEEEIEPHFLLSYDVDSLTVHIKMKRKVAGRLTQRTLEYLKNGLKVTTGEPLNNLATLAIIYYPGEDKCNRKSNKSFVRTRLEDFQEYTIKRRGVQSFYIYKNTEGLKVYQKAVRWHKDYNGSIEKMFFPLHYPCGSFVVIQPDGRYYSYKGEYSFSQVKEVLEKESLFLPKE